jgi:hypothetical protein
MDRNEQDLYCLALDVDTTPADQDGFTDPQTWDDNGVYLEG